MAVWMDDDVDEDDGPAPWALGHDDDEPMEDWAEEEDDDADPWLDEQLAELRPIPSSQTEPVLSADQSGEGASGGMVLRRPAPARAPRRRHAEVDVLADLPVRSVPGYGRDRRADVPFGVWAPELTASRLLDITEVARLVGVSPATISAYLSRGRMPEPVMRGGRVPVWSRPIIRQWLSARPGQGRRVRKPR